MSGPLILGVHWGNVPVSAAELIVKAMLVVFHVPGVLLRLNLLCLLMSLQLTNA